jgi:putative sterol carrier protein
MTAATTSDAPRRRRRRPLEYLSDRFAHSVRRQSEERLDAIMRGWRRQGILRQVFFGMPRSLDRQAAGDLAAVVEYRIRGRRDGGADRYQLSIEQGRARARRGGDATPTVALELDPVPFLHLVSGVATGPELFMRGRLQIDGDLMLATQLPSLFRIPQAR